MLNSSQNVTQPWSFFLGQPPAATLAPKERQIDKNPSVVKTRREGTSAQ